MWILISISILSFSFDQITKNLAEGLGQEINLIDNLFKISLTLNSGIAFGIPFSGLPQKTVSVLLLAISVYLSIKFLDIKKKHTQILLGFIFGGIAGNLFDRFFREGGVIDFIDFSFFPSFNFADSFISIGIVILIIFYEKFAKNCAQV